MTDQPLSDDWDDLVELLDLADDPEADTTLKRELAARYPDDDWMPE